ncbi:MAG: GNAT family N-acetyltransferase [Pseudomonadota bacterium]
MSPMLKYTAYQPRAGSRLHHPPKNLSNHLVRIRRLTQLETGIIRDHLLRLDRKSRELRFGHAVSDAYLEKHASEIFEHRSLVKGCFVDGICRGVGEAFFTDDDRGEVEAAFSVEARWQGHGLGTLIFQRLLRAVQNRGANTVCVLCMRSNDPMIRIAEKLDGAINVMPDGVTGEILPNPANGFLSFQAEMMEEMQWMQMELPD